MTKKYYVYAAETLASMRMTTPTDYWVAMVDFMIEIFTEDNPLFDAEKFKEACYK